MLPPCFPPTSSSMSSPTTLSDTIGMDDASAESVKLPGMADPCKAENLAHKDRRRRQPGREAVEKVAAEKAVTEMVSYEDMDFGPSS